MSATFTRRRLLGLLAAAGIGAVGWRLADESGADSPEGRLAAVLGDQDAARSVGRRYLATHPGEADEQALLRLLGPLGDPDVLAREQLTVRVRRAVRDDFAGGRVVLVDGWYLSETEARLCALATFV
jgi:hypothetical protein